MSTPITFNPTITTAGQAAAVNAANNGLQLSITAISFGTGNYVPSASQTALQAQVTSINIGAGALVNPNQIRMSAMWSDNTSNCAIYEVGFWAGSTLFAVWSAGGGSNSPLGYKTPGVNFILFNDLYFSQLPPSSVTVQVDSGQSAFLSALTAHEVANNAHPQYQLIADAVDFEPNLWCGVAGGTPNNLILTLPVSQTVMAAYSAGQRFVFKAQYNNTGAVTAQILLPSGTLLSAQTVTKTGTTALNPGDIAAGSIYQLFFDGNSGAQFQISGGAGGAAARSVTEYTISTAQAQANQTASLSLSASYTVGLVDVFMQGRDLSSSDFTATDGATIQFPAGTFSGGEAIRIVSWSSFNIANASQFRSSAEFTLSQGQTSQAVQYTPNMIDVYLNGDLLSVNDYTATSGTSISFSATLQAMITSGDLLAVKTYAPYAVANAVDLVTNQTVGVPKNFLNLSSGTAQMPNAGAFSFRNLLINAAGNINQRGYTSGTASTASNQYAIDRWKINTSGQVLSWTTNGAGVTFTAPAGGITQIVEGASIIGGTYTLSWTGSATATINGTAIASGGSITLTANTNATVVFIGGTYSFPQLELGTNPTNFEMRPYQVEMALCQRYFESIASIPWTRSTSGYQYLVGLTFKQTKRATPTVVVTSGGVSTPTAGQIYFDGGVSANMASTTVATTTSVSVQTSGSVSASGCAAYFSLTADADL